MKDHLHCSQSGFTVRILIISLLTWLFFGSANAQDRLFIGFKQQKALKSLALTQDWLNQDMGKIFWPLVYDQLWLLGPAPAYRASPGLASGWETTDYKTWRFFINTKARFSDQIAVSLNDIVFSLNLFTKTSDAWNKRRVAIESFKAIDDNLLEVTLQEPHSGPYPPFYRMPILPRHIWKKYERNPALFRNNQAIGSGPYFVKEFKPGESLRLVKNQHHHNQAARYDEIVILIFANDDPLHTALKSGLIDFFGYDGIDPSRIREFESAMGVKTVVTDGTDLYWLSFNLSKNNAIRNLNVRKALMSAIDKKAIIRQVFGGYAKEIHSLVYPELSGFNKDVAKNRFNLQQAKALLTQAGYTDLNDNGFRDDPQTRQDLSFTLLVSSADRVQIGIAQSIRQQIAQLGVKINLKRVEASAYASLLRQPLESEHDIAINSQAPGPYQDWIWSMMKSDEDLYNETNHSHYINHAFDRVFDKLLTTTSPTRKSKYVALAQEILADDLPYGMLVRPYKICPIRQERSDGIVISMGGISSEINLWNYLIPPREN